MTETFYRRIPTLSHSELLDYIHNSSKYKPEAVETAATELKKRGYSISNDTLMTIQESLYQKNSEKHLVFFPPDRILKNIRIRYYTFLSLVILTIGWGSAVIVYLTAEPAPSDPLGYDPLDTKKYLRQLEVYGGKINVFGAEFMQWFDGLWHGRSLAFTIGFLSAALALMLWFIGIHLQTGPDKDFRNKADLKAN